MIETRRPLSSRRGLFMVVEGLMTESLATMYHLLCRQIENDQEQHETLRCMRLTMFDQEIRSLQRIVRIPGHDDRSEELDPAAELLLRAIPCIQMYRNDVSGLLSSGTSVIARASLGMTFSSLATTKHNKIEHCTVQKLLAALKREIAYYLDDTVLFSPDYHLYFKLSPDQVVGYLERIFGEKLDPVRAEKARSETSRMEHKMGQFTEKCAVFDANLPPTELKEMVCKKVREVLSRHYRLLAA